ncbi:MAG: ATP-binding cassette domain-containing protein [Eubacteriaceae bacterium]
MRDIEIRGLTQNNLKHIDLNIKKEKITVFTGVSGSGKSSIVFDTIAAEAQRQMNETYPAFLRSRLPKHPQPHAELIQNLTPAVIVDQSSLGGNARSTVGTSSELYGILRLLFSRIGQPYGGTASDFSFNSPGGMCPVCDGLGKTVEIDMDSILDRSKSWNEGCVLDSTFKVGQYFWRQYRDSGMFDPDVKIKDLPEDQYNRLMYGAAVKGGPRENPKLEGVYNKYSRFFLNRDLSKMSKAMQRRAKELVVQSECPACHGKKLNEKALASKINGFSIADMSAIELTELYQAIDRIDDPRAATMTASLKNGISRLIRIGLPYLNLNRETSTLSGGEAQRLKLVRFMGSSLTGMTYIFDEPSTGLHPRDVYRMNELLLELRDKGNTVLVVEHDPDVIRIADEIIDIGPMAGKAGGEVVFQGDYAHLLRADTLTARSLSSSLPVKKHPRQWTKSLPVRDACVNNLRHVDADFPLGVMTVVTGVAGSGKSSLVTQCFAREYADDVILVDQGPITATNRSTPASYLGFYDRIRRLFAEENGVSDSLFSFNSDGACPACKGKGVIVTELAYMDPVVSTCEVCGGDRFSAEALSYRLGGKNILEVLSMTVNEALEFFHDKRIQSILKNMKDVGLSYMTLGQPLSTLSGGERQRIKLAKHLKKKGSIFILDEPTTGLHRSDVEKLITLFDRMVDHGNTMIIIEHDLDFVKSADWIIDIGPDGGREGGQIVFTGTPQQMADSAETITGACLKKSLSEK